MAQDYSVSVLDAILRKQFLTLFLFVIEIGIVHLKLVLARFELFENFRLAVLFAVLFRVYDDMHPVAFIVHLARGDQVRTYWVLFRKICCEVHFLPFEYLFEFVGSWKSKLSQVPTLDKVKLAV